MSEKKDYRPREKALAEAESRGRLKAATDDLRQWRLDAKHRRTSQRPPKEGFGS